MRALVSHENDIHGVTSASLEDGATIIVNSQIKKERRMKGFIEVTCGNGEVGEITLVNINQILRVEAQLNGCYLEMASGGEHFYLTETYGEVKKLIDEAQG